MKMKMNKDKTIVITGANGFIGSHLAIKLYNEGYTIICVDKPNTPDGTLTVNRILSDFAKNIVDKDDLNNRFKIIGVNILDLTEENVENIFKDNNISVIYHLASPIGVDMAISDPTRMLLNGNFINTTIYEIAKQYDIPVIYASSSEVLGNGEEGGDETFSMSLPGSDGYTPRSSYALMKTMGEMLFSELNGIIVRFFNIIGPGQTTPSNIVPAIVNSVNSDFIIRSNNDRTYCDISVCVGALFGILDNLEECKGKTINISSGDNKLQFNPEELFNIFKESYVEKGITLSHICDIDSSDSINNRCAIENYKNIIGDRYTKDCLYDIRQIVDNIVSFEIDHARDNI